MSDSPSLFRRLSMRFSAAVVSGAGRGKRMGIPTLNLKLSDIPPELKEGIYACFVILGDRQVMGAMHYGPRPVFDDLAACEVHLLDEEIADPPEAIEVEVREYIREVRNFASQEDLIAQIQDDIRAARSILTA